MGMPKSVLGKRVREADQPSLPCHNPPETEDMKEFRVKQEFKDEVDINRIIERRDRGIQPPPWMTARTPFYGDFSDAPASFQEAFALVQEAEEAFLSLPLAMRKELDHDPRNLDHADRDMYERYGLLKKPEAAPGSTLPGDAPVAQGSGDTSPQKSAKAKPSKVDTPSDS